jgi:4-amino-4-deoxy-L-arabinose transferase-like glycosyltransferase
MARSGDWVTPRLWGEPWFEKPALLYWMTALAFRAGLAEDLASRLPVAMLSVAFLGFLWWAMRREFGERAAWFAALILATTGGWLGYGSIGATDLPMSAFFGAAVLLAVPWVDRGDARGLPAAAACLGAAVLAKGLVPLVLVLPVLWMGRRRWRDLAKLRTAGVFLAVAAPWYVLCYLRNGAPFVQKFFLEHHFGRFASEALQHRQPWWFYLPVLAAGLLPWTPLAVLLPRAGLLADRRTRLLAVWVVWGLIFFSASTNKLPGYVLPLLPAAAALLAVALDRAPRARLTLAACGVVLIALPMAAQLLPASLASGLSRASRPAPQWIWGIPVLAAAAAWALEAGKRRAAAVWLLTATAAAGVLHLKESAYPEIDRVVSARRLWRALEPMRDKVCIDGIHRSQRYGLNYYSVIPLPECQAIPMPVRVVQEPGRAPVIAGP